MSKINIDPELLRKPPKLKNKLIHGVGVNDADYQVCQTISNKRIECLFYRKWTNMLRRCYSSKYQGKYPTYKGCYVVDEWLLFSNFRSWMIKQDWKNKELDKDIIKPMNKVYSPDFCSFVTRDINNILTDSAASRGKYPQGVYWHKTHKKFIAKCRQKGKQKCIGYFSNVEAASNAYLNQKIKILLSAAWCQLDSRVADGLRSHAILLSKKLNKREGKS